MKRCRLAVIGSGAAALGVATRVRAAGWSVGVIDHRPFGGTCKLRGCDPKKAMVGVAQAAEQARRRIGSGLAGDVRIDWARLVAFKRGFTDPQAEKTERSLAEQGIERYRGRARFLDRGTLAVDGDALEAEHVVIAVGAEPAPLGIRGEQHLATSEDFMALPALPPRIVFVGGGYIAAEFSHLAASAGANVTVLQHGERMLAHFDPDVVGWLMEASAALGIETRTETSVEAVETMPGGYRVHAMSRGRTVAVDADLVVHAAGRKPPLDGLDLEAGGVAAKDGRLRLNEHLQSVSNPAVYAAGDAAQAGPPLTPVAAHDAKVVAANLLDGNRHRPDYRAVPSVVFTIPPLAMVGASEAEARERGLRVRVNARKASDWFTARQAAEPAYGFKVLVDEDSGFIVGAHVVGPHADELINLFALAMRHGLTADDLRATLFAYPTAASDIGYML
jgi:glutathione reductase (NADPH)